MITPAAIRQKAARKYHTFLRARVQNEPFFPLEIRFRKAKASDDYLALRDWVQALLVGSKAERGFGYVVELVERELRRYGRQSLPARIAIETETDYLRLIGKTAEFNRWQTAVSQTLAQFPQLESWLAQYPQRLLPHLDVWDDLLTVCGYFVNHPHPTLYARELPLPVHTKFVEDNQAILRQLLDELLPEEALSADETHFERRFGLCYDEPAVRLRLLDAALPSALGWPVADLALPLSACADLTGLNGRPVFIVENKMTFLTLPPAPQAVAIWGGGFRVTLLRDIGWLADCPIWYWGDLDAQGFAILSQLRGYWPQTRSFLMDWSTLEKYSDFIVAGTPDAGTHLSNLTPAETAVYRHLSTHTLRLEQERIRHTDVAAAMQQLRSP